MCESMQTLSLDVTFLVPAFVGDAQQTGAWRTPPFKALLRQWWRVAVAQEHGYDWRAIRAAEGQLFGHAWLDGDRDRNGKKVSARQSRLRLRLEDWRPGALKQWSGHCGKVNTGGKSPDSDLYLGYGPLVSSRDRSRPGAQLKKNAAIQAGETQRLHLAFPQGEAGAIERTLDLIEAYGALGGRSRNGWGSVSFGRDLAAFEAPLLPWKEAIQRDWAHGIGHDEHGALVWETGPQQKWEALIRELAQLRADLRRAVSDRLLLAHPSTKQSMPGWDKNARLPHSLRFKIRREAEGLVGTVFHAPCRPPDALWNSLGKNKQDEYVKVHAQAHRFFDDRLERVFA